MQSENDVMAQAAASANRPKFWAWHRLDGRTLRAAAAEISASHGVSVSHTQLWFVSLALDDGRRLLPSDQLREAIRSYTNGVVGLDDWPPLPSAKPADEDWSRKDFVGEGIGQ